MEYFEEIQDRVILIGVQADRGDDMEESLDELGELAATAGAAVAGRIIQNREAVHPGTYTGQIPLYLSASFGLRHTPHFRCPSK